MNYTKVMPAIVYAPFNQQKKWESLTLKDVEEIMQTPNGMIAVRKVEAEAARRMTADILRDSYTKLKVKQDELYEVIGCADFLRGLHAIENIFKKAADDQERKGFQKWALSVKDIIKGFVSEHEYIDDNSTIDYPKMKEQVERINKEYDLDIQFISQKVNEDMQIDQLNCWEDESIFKDMTAWEIYMLGLRNGDHAVRYLLTHATAEALAQKHYGKTTVKDIMSKISDIMVQTKTADDVEALVKRMNKMGYDFTDEYKKDAMNYKKYYLEYLNRYRWEK